MSNWSPKPVRPEDPNPLFQMNEEYTVKKSLSPIEHQRLADGTPHTVPGPTRLHPGNVEPVHESPELYLEQMEKSDPPAPKLDADLIVKSFLEKGTGKNIATQAIRTASGVARQGAQTAVGVATTAVKGKSDKDDDEDK